MNPYDDIVAEDTQGGRGQQRPHGQTGGPLDSGGSDTSSNPYQQSVDEDLRNMEVLRRQQSMQASMKDSGQARKARELGKRTGIPPEVAEEDSQRIEQETKSKDIHDELAQFDQDEQQWFMRDNNLASLQDDLPRMRALAEAAKRHPQDDENRSTLGNIARGTGEMATQLGANFLQFVGGTAERIENTLTGEQGLNLPNPSLIYDDPEKMRQNGQEPDLTIGNLGFKFVGDIDPGETRAPFSALAEDVEAGGESLDYQPEYTAERIKEDPSVENVAGFIAEQGVKSLPHMAGIMLNAPAYTMSRTQEIAEQRVENTEGREGVRSGDIVRAAPAAVGTSLIERFATSRLFNPVTKTAVGTIGTATAREAGTEFVQEQAEYAGASIGTDQPFDVLESLERGAFGALAGAGMGGAISSMQQTYTGIKRMKRGRQDRRYLENVKKFADEARQGNADQDQVRELVGMAKQKGPVSELYIDSGQFREVLEQNGLDPEDVANHMPSVREQFYEANAIGGDLTVSLEDYAAVLSETAAAEDFISKARTEQRGMSPEEADRWMEEEAKPMIERALSFDPEEQRAPITQIQEDLTGQLLGAGYPQNVAEVEAERMATTFARIANMTGDDPVEFYQQHGPRIQRSQPDTRPKQRETSELDNLIDRLRRGEFPADRDVRGPSLVQFLREQGGVADEGGELAARDVDEGLQPFTKKLIQDTGMAPDHAAERAAEAGFISERDPNQLMEAIDREVRGEPVYSPQNEDPQMRDLEADLGVLDEELQRAGLDLNTMSNDEVVAELERIAGEQPQQAGEALAEEGVPEGGPEQVKIFRGEAADGVRFDPGGQGEGQFWTTDADMAQRFAGEEGTLREAMYKPGTNRLVLVNTSKDDPDFPTVTESVPNEEGLQELERLLGERGEEIAREIRGEEVTVGTEAILEPEDYQALKEAGVDVVAGNNMEGQTEYVLNPEVLTDPPLPRDEDGQIQTDADAFQRWFGDSKVVDENGDPLVVYHGTTNPDITEFVPAARKGSEESRRVLDKFRSAVENNERVGGIVFRSGSFFTPDPEFANNYTGEGSGAVYPVYVKAENPVYFDSRTRKVVGGKPEGTPDSLITLTDGEITEVAVIDPTQVKSVNNRGTFDPQDPNILNQEGAPDAGDQDPLRQDETGRNLEEDYQVEDLSDDPAIRQLLEKYSRSIEDRADDRAGAGPRGRRGAGPERGRTGRPGAGRTITGRQPDESWRNSTRLVSGGAPRRVWRGSRNGLTPDSYNESQMGAGSENPNAALGVWYTTKEGEARGRYDRGVVEDFYLDIRKPKVYKTKDVPRFESQEQSRRLREQLREQGYDSVVFDYRDIGEGYHVVSFDPEQAIIPEDQAADPDALNQDQPRLSAIHNLSAENLVFADQLGGIAAPSIAVVTEEQADLRGFGEISLIGGRSVANPEKDPVFSSDAYTKRFPQPEYGRASEKKAKALVDRIRPYAQKFDDRGVDSVTWDSAINTPDPQEMMREWRGSFGAKAMYLEEVHGEQVEPVMEEARLQAPFVEMPAFREWKAERDALADAELPEGYEIIEVQPPNPNLTLYAVQGPDGNKVSGDMGSPESAKNSFRDDILDPRPGTERYREYSEAVDRAIQQYAEQELADFKPEDRQELIDTFRREYFSDRGEVAFGKNTAIDRSWERAGQREVDRRATRKEFEQRMEGREGDFDRWLRDTVMDIFPEPRIRLGRQKVPYTLDNIVEAMTRQGTVKAEESTLVFGGGEARAQAAERFSDIETMREAAKDAIVDPEAYGEAKEQTEALQEEFRESVAKYYRFGSLMDPSRPDTWAAFDGAMRAIGRVAGLKTRNRQTMTTALRREDFNVGSIPQDVIDKGLEAVEATRSAPVPYFEAKPQRAVQLSEFEGAVIPEDTSPEVREILERNGIEYVEASQENRVEALRVLRSRLADQGKDVLFQNQDRRRRRDDPRGTFFYDTMDRAVIQLSEAADLTTLPHESYHLFLDIMNSVKDRSTEVQGELGKVRDWLSRNTDDLRRDAQKYARDAGLTDVEAQIKEMPKEELQQFYADNDLSLRGLPENGVDRMLAKAGLEYFARGGEAYLMEGKAPSADMAGVFRRLKQWFIQVYESAKQLGVNLDDDIRGVFDRMIATEEQIEQAREMAEYGTTLADVETLDWTEAEREKVARLNGEAREQAERELMRQQMKDHQKTQQQWWENEKAEVRREVLDELNKQPVYQARAMLTSGTRPDGEALPEGVEPIKLDREALVAEFGEEYIQRLPSPRNPGNKASSYTYTREGGVDPQMVARLYGFNNTRGLIEALIESRPIQTYVDNLVEAEMRQRHPNINFSGEAVEAAREAVYNDKQAQVMLAEMRKLESRVGARESLPQLFRNKARESVESKAIKDLRPDLYQRKSAKFEREAMRAAMDSRFQEALEAKQKALMHHYLFREASRAREESEKIYRYAKRLSKKSAQERIGKAGADYLDRVNEILGQYEFRRVTKKELERRKSLRDWVEEKQASGEHVDIPETVLARAETVNWREVTLDELAGMRDALKNLEHVARFKNRLVTDKEKRELQEVVDSVTEQLDKTQGQKKGKGFFEQKKWAENMREAGQDYASIALNMDSIVRALDGYEEVGPVYQAIKRPIDEAARNRLPALQQQYGEQMMEMYNRHFTRQEQREMVKDNWVEVEGRGWISREQALSLALNWGNEYNREAVMAGVASARDKLQPQEVRRILDSLTKADWDFAQDVWDMMDYDLWPQVKEAQRQRTGITPEKVEASPVQTKFGTYRGGYYPVTFDRELGWRVTAQEAEKMAQDVRMGGFAKAQTQRGHTISRTGTGQLPVKLSLNVLHGHVNQVLTDLALGDAVNDVSKVLNNNEFKSSMERTGNTWALRAMDSWLKDTAAQEVVGQDVLSKFARRVRTGFTVSKLAWNVGTILLQPTGLAQSTVLVGYRDMAAGLSAFAKGKWVGEGNIVEQVRSRSKFMESRGASFNKDIDATQAALQGSGLMEAMLEKIPLLQTLTKQHGAQKTSEMIKDSLLGGIVAVQQVVDAVTWLGAYEKGKREQPSDADAVQYADNMVARTQASGLFSDRTAFERGSLNNNTRQSEFVRLWTVLGSYMFAKGNIMYERTNSTDFKSPTQILKWTHDMALLFIFESLFIGVMRNLMPDEDDEETMAGWVAKETGNNVLATMPLIRDGASVLQGFQGGGALGSFWEQVGRAGVQVSQGEVDAALLENLNDVGGTIFRYPSGQINRTLSAMWEDMNGEDVEMIDYLLWRQQEE